MPVSDAQLLDAFRSAVQRGSAADAVRVGERLIERDARREDVVAYLCTRALDAGDAERTRMLAERGLAATPGSAVLAFHLGCALEALREPALARDAFGRAHASDPRFLTARFWESDQVAALGAGDDAVALSTAALAQAEREGMLAALGELPAYVRTRIERSIDRVRDAQAAALACELAPLRARHPPGALRRIDSALDAHLGRTPRALPHPLQRPSFLCVPGLPPAPWFERSRFPFLDAIEAATDAIREELLPLLADRSALAPYVDMPDGAPAAAAWRELNRSARWSAYHLYRHGGRVEAHAARCPRTIAALDGLPLMRIPGHSPEALFSVLEPRTHIPPHTGVINGRLTVHLPLIVPPDCGRLVAGGEARTWEEGRCLVFDDSFVHEAWNDSDRTRVVLIFDIWNPDLDAAEREALALAIATIGAFNRRYGAQDATHES